MEAKIDKHMQFDDMIKRLRRLADDMQEGLDEERDFVQQALHQASLDRKPVYDVLQALRLDWLCGIGQSCDHEENCTYTHMNGAIDMEYMRSFFDNFHYDIGHNKGVGAGPDSASAAHY